LLRTTYEEHREETGRQEESQEEKVALNTFPNLFSR